MASATESFEVFADSPLFASLTAEETEDVLKVCARLEAPAGAVLFRQADTAAGAFLIAAGTVEVRLQTDRGVEVLAQLGPGDVVGELSLIDRGPRSATAVLTSDGLLLELTGVAFDALRAEMHPGAYKIVRELTLVVCTRLRAVNARIEDALASGPAPSPKAAKAGGQGGGEANDGEPSDEPGLFRRLLRRLWGQGDDA